MAFCIVFSFQGGWAYFFRRTQSRHNREQVELINDLKQREIKHIDNINRLEKELGEAKQKIVDAENRLAEERLAVVEERRQLEEEKQKFAIERAEKKKMEQDLILGKKKAGTHIKSRSRISFGIKAKQ